MLGREVGVSTQADTMTSDVNASYFTSLWALFHLFKSRAEENIKNFKSTQKIFSSNQSLSLSELLCSDLAKRVGMKYFFKKEWGWTIGVELFRKGGFFTLT